MVGIIYGTVNVLLAIGLILIYRTNRFLNFSYAAMGSLFGFTPSPCTSSATCRTSWSSARGHRWRACSAR